MFCGGFPAVSWLHPAGGFSRPILFLVGIRKVYGLGGNVLHLFRPLSDFLNRRPISSQAEDSTFFFVPYGVYLFRYLFPAAVCLFKTVHEFFVLLSISYFFAVAKKQLK